MIDNFPWAAFTAPPEIGASRYAMFLCWHRCDISRAKSGATVAHEITVDDGLKYWAIPFSSENNTDSVWLAFNTTRTTTSKSEATWLTSLFKPPSETNLST